MSQLWQSNVKHDSVWWENLEGLWNQWTKKQHWRLEEVVKLWKTETNAEGKSNGTQNMNLRSCSEIAWHPTKIKLPFARCQRLLCCSFRLLSISSDMVPCDTVTPLGSLSNSYTFTKLYWTYSPVCAPFRSSLRSFSCRMVPFLIWLHSTSYIIIRAFQHLFPVHFPFKCLASSPHSQRTVCHSCLIVPFPFHGLLELPIRAYWFEILWLRLSLLQDAWMHM